MEGPIGPFRSATFASLADRFRNSKNPDPLHASLLRLRLEPGKRDRYAREKGNVDQGGVFRPSYVCRRCSSHWGRPGNYQQADRVSPDKRASRQCLISGRDADFSATLLFYWSGVVLSRRLSGTPLNLFFPQLNLPSDRLRRKSSGFLQVAASKARNRSVLMSTHCRPALPIQH
jgi:hypothetical protein